MSETLSGKTVSSNVDKSGNPVAEQTELFVDELRSRSRNTQVLCHWAESGRVGWWGESGLVSSQPFEIAEQHDHRVDVVGTRVIERFGGQKQSVVYVEFVPKFEVEEVSVDE